MDRGECESGHRARHPVIVKVADLIPQLTVCILEQDAEPQIARGIQAG